MGYAQGPSPAEASMKTLDFKDKFFPGIHWQRQLPTATHVTTTGGPLSQSQSSGNRTESMHVDNILAGIRQDERRLFSPPESRVPQSRLAPVKEDPHHETHSHSSATS